MSTPASRRVVLRSGDRVQLRALRRDDRDALVAMFDQLSDDSRYRRFFTVKPRLSEPTLDYLADVDHHDHEALVAVAPGGDLVGVARFIRDPQRPDAAEFAVTVVDSWQGRGLGTVLLRRLSARAADEGVRHFTADILVSNKPMLELVQTLGETDISSSDGRARAVVELADQHEPVEISASSLLRAAARGEFLPLPTPLRGLVDLSGEVTRTLLVPVSAVLGMARRRTG